MTRNWIDDFAERCELAETVTIPGDVARKIAKCLMSDTEAYRMGYTRGGAHNGRKLVAMIEKLYGVGVLVAAQKLLNEEGLRSGLTEEQSDEMRKEAQDELAGLSEHSAD